MCFFFSFSSHSSSATSGNLIHLPIHYTAIQSPFIVRRKLCADSVSCGSNVSYVQYSLQPLESQ